MTTYQKQWNSIIENLLIALDAPDHLHTNIVDTLANSGRSGIFPNQVISALQIGISIKEGNRDIAFVASMQSGKSGTIYFLSNYVLPAIGFIRKFESILFVTSMRDKDLYNQNCRNLQADFYDASEDLTKSSNIEVMKMSDFFSHPNPHKVVNEYNVQLIIRDEDQYGCGEESCFQIAFFSELRRRMPKIKLLAVSATPYDILDAQFNGDADVDVVEGTRPAEYYGISEMLREHKIEDLPHNFSALQSVDLNGDIYYSMHPKVEEYINYLNNFEDGLGIIRESNTSRVLELQNQIKSKYKEECTAIVIGSDQACNFSINDGIKEVANLILKRGKRVVLIIVQALTAGKDLGILKEKIRFGIEPRDRQLANGAQGITGRFCGYHKNRDFKLLASKSLLEHYAQFEQDWEIFADNEWRNELFNNNVRGLSTQTKLVNTHKEGAFTPIVSIDIISYVELQNQDTRELLSFIDKASYDKLLGFFEPSFYSESTKGTRFHQEGVTVRIASSYNQNSNRVYRNWNYTIHDDFGNVFFKKNSYEYGILISNYPVEDSRNTLGFCGIKLIQSGAKEWRTQATDVENNSMYVNREVA